MHDKAKKTIRECGTTVRFAVVPTERTKHFVAQVPGHMQHFAL